MRCILFVLDDIHVQSITLDALFAELATRIQTAGLLPYQVVHTSASLGPAVLRTFGLAPSESEHCLKIPEFAFSLPSEINT